MVGALPSPDVLSAMNSAPGTLCMRSSLTEMVMFVGAAASEKGNVAATTDKNAAQRELHGKLCSGIDPPYAAIMMLRSCDNPWSPAGAWRDVKRGMA
jgi:hypothetical protein